MRPTDGFIYMRSNNKAKSKAKSKPKLKLIYL